MDWLLEKVFLYPRRSAVLFAVVLVAGIMLGWWFIVWQNPRRVFEDMLASNLATTSVTEEAHAANNGQSVEQYARLQMGGGNAAHWLVSAKQSGVSVTTESIATPTVGYIRYTNIVVGQQAATAGTKSLANVLNVWAKADGVTDTALNQLFSQTLLNINNAPLPPIGNLPYAQQQNILAYMRDQKIFVPDYRKVVAQTMNGRPVYTYQVSVPLGAYIRMMQAFAHDLGLKTLDTLDPNQYSTVQPLTVTMSVDRLSHQLVRVGYGGTGYVQNYVDWGLMTPITLPHASVTTTTLQNRINTLSVGAAPKQ